MVRVARMTASITALLVALLSCRMMPADSPQDNLLPNASFETLKGGQPVGWQQASWQGNGRLTVVDGGRTGRHALQIASEAGADIAWSTNIPVRPNATYRLSGWIKTEGVRRAPDRPGRGALLNVHNSQRVATPPVTGTHDWQRVEVVFDTVGQDSIQVNCLFGGWGLVTGKAWFDDVQLQLVSARQWKPTITIQMDEKGEPISKYIYGQFIEHLGRCIYGGIWAEMLADRKFFYPVTARYAPYRDKDSDTTSFPILRASPWEILGADNAVRMVTDGSFVGEHTPLVQPGTTLKQHRLGLVRGKRYVGYIWCKAVDDEGRVTLTLSQPSAVAVFTCGSQRYSKHTFSFVAAKTDDCATLSISVAQQPCLIGTVSLMPADNVHGMRADTLELLKQLNAPVYRWPGGNFVSGYNWKDGIGERDRRPPRTNPAWTGVEHNDFGLDEFMVLCRVLNAEPYIAVNSGLGDVTGAIEELQYANGSSETSMGKLRARNGHPAPYRVKWWGIGNEMYGKWQLGHMSLEKYMQKHNRFATAMRQTDPAIRIVAVGAVGKWSEGMMQHCAEQMDLISEHFYCGERPGLVSHVAQIPQAIRSKAEAHRRYRQQFNSLQGKDIRIALDEWNYWYGPHVFGELGTRYHLKDALGIAAGLHEYMRQSDIFFMANYAQTVNVIGCIKTSRTKASFATTGLVLQLYRREFGEIPLRVKTTTPLDAMAALTDDGRFLTLGIVNPTMEPIDVPLDIQGGELQGPVTRWEIAGSDPMAYNEPGKKPRIRITEKRSDVAGPTISIAPCSVTLLKFKIGE